MSALTPNEQFSSVWCDPSSTERHVKCRGVWVTDPSKPCRCECHHDPLAFVGAEFLKAAQDASPDCSDDPDGVCRDDGSFTCGRHAAIAGLVAKVLELANDACGCLDHRAEVGRALRAGR